MSPLLLATGAQALLGGIQSLTSGSSGAQAELEAAAKRSPLYKGSKSIEDYYQQALNRYQASPYQSQQYQIGAKNIQRATAQGISALQDRRGGIGGISRLAAGQSDALANLGAQAEAQRNQRFGQLGSASQMKASEDYRKFDINQMTPYQRDLQLKQMKSQAANERRNAGLQMLGGAASNLAMGAMMNQPTSSSSVMPEAAVPGQSSFDTFMGNRPEIRKAPKFTLSNPRISSMEDFAYGRRQRLSPYTRTNLPTSDLTNLQLNYR